MRKYRINIILPEKVGLILMCILATFSSLLGQDSTGTMMDIEGNTYKTIKIGNQWWMAENLKVTHYRNGDALPNITTNSSWASLSSGAYCNYNNDEAYVATYGRLYNWHAVNDSRGLAPVGWHVPSDAEWQALIDYLGGSSNGGGKLKETGTVHWQSPNEGATNESGFTALPGGRRRSIGPFDYLGYAGYFWTSTVYDITNAYAQYLDCVNSDIDPIDIQNQNGLSVRCIRSDNIPPSASFNGTPSSGTTQIDFQFDASNSTDVEDPVAALKIRWDWTNDGHWDTDFSTTKTAKHQYPTAGTYTIALEVKDTGGLTNTTTRKITVMDGTLKTVIDIDGNIYKTLRIGNQWWMAENLKVTHYRNGDAIPNMPDDIRWGSLGTGAYCTYNNDEAYVATYGRLYNWHAVNDSRGLAPEGWHVASDEEWDALVSYFGSGSTTGDKLKETGTEHWLSSNTGATNESGFTALPGGYRLYKGVFGGLRSNANIWSSTNDYGAEAVYWSLTSSSSGVSSSTHDKRCGFSVRCVKDAELYSLSLLAAPSTGGNVLQSGPGSYIPGSTVTITARPNIGYTFTYWSGDATGSANPLSVTIDSSNKTITANFALNAYSLTVNATNGSVTKNPDQSSYNAGSSVILTATPSPGYSFTNWSGDATGSANPLTVTMDANKSITANFELDQTNPVVKINLRAILQGCFNANIDQMSTLLNAGSYLPQTSPYCEDQCSVSSIPIDVTDWVLVQLFNSDSDAPLVSKSVFLRRDGYLVDNDGNIGINVNAHPGNYFVGLVHRNHLTILTSSAITLSTNEEVLYDFTTGADKCYGGNGSVELEPGIWGMWAGDINHDGLVTTRDYKIWFESERAGSAGYLHSDVNLDGVVNDSDYSIWLSNSQKGATSYKRIGDTSGICLSADSLNFGAVAVGDESEKTIYLNNTGTAILQITSLNIDNTSFSILGSSYYSIESGSYQGVKVRFTPTSSIHYTAVLQINNNSADGVKEVTLTGTGSEFGTVTDIDGNIYKTVKIGNQWWMAENLKVKHYRNGEEIPYVIGSGSWATLTTGAYCYYDYRDDLGSKYGGLYNWYAVNDSRGLAPEGWHLPSDAEWQTLKDYLNGDAAAGGKMKVTGEAWASPNTGATNESGFSALPGGEIDEVGTFRHSYTNGKFWYSSDFSNDAAWYCSLYYAGSYADRTGAFKRTGLSVRCIRD